MKLVVGGILVSFEVYVILLIVILVAVIVVVVVVVVVVWHGVANQKRVFLLRVEPVPFDSV